MVRPAAVTGARRSTETPPRAAAVRSRAREPGAFRVGGRRAAPRASGVPSARSRQGARPAARHRRPNARVASRGNHCILALSPQAVTMTQAAEPPARLSRVQAESSSQAGTAWQPEALRPGCVTPACRRRGPFLRRSDRRSGAGPGSLRHGQ
jgi:hypothetical protein